MSGMFIFCPSLFLSPSYSNQFMFDRLRVEFDRLRVEFDRRRVEFDRLRIEFGNTHLVSSSEDAGPKYIFLVSKFLRTLSLSQESAS